MPDVSVSESVTITELVDAYKEQREISVSDAVSVETWNQVYDGLAWLISATESVSASDTVNVAEGWSLSVGDSVTVTERRVIIGPLSAKLLNVSATDASRT